MDTIADAIERLETMIERRPGFGVVTCRSVTTLTTTLTEPMTCATTEGPWTTTADLPSVLGGSDSAPTPSTLLRAALGSCMAMTYRLRAARHGVDVSEVRVTVESDSELAGMLIGDSEAPPGFTGMRYHVEIASRSEPAEVVRIVDEGDGLSPILDALSRATSVTRTLSVRVPAMRDGD